MVADDPDLCHLTAADRTFGAGPLEMLIGTFQRFIVKGEDSLIFHRRHRTTPRIIDG
ncbi:hypothetical protein MINT15_31850 [Saccharomonospora viridis]|uniref:Uncharacterized protein n=1 Tax=Saccharomonospora viridis TaxID=1852 RepID=A0A837D5E7_9PSEU|nr:hypothetical protein MINT15_31850 [Saccharomonospora viridis]